MSQNTVKVMHREVTVERVYDVVARFRDAAVERFASVKSRINNAVSLAAIQTRELDDLVSASAEAAVAEHASHYLTWEGAGATEKARAESLIRFLTNPENYRISRGHYHTDGLYAQERSAAMLDLLDRL